MYLVAIAWLYVALMMAVAEATHAQGSVLGAIVTFVLYGLAPIALVMYLLGTPMRRRARREAEALERAQAQADATHDPPHTPIVPGDDGSTVSGPDHDEGGLPPGDPIAPERKVP